MPSERQWTSERVIAELQAWAAALQRRRVAPRCAWLPKARVAPRRGPNCSGRRCLGTSPGATPTPASLPESAGAVRGAAEAEKAGG